MQYEFKGSGLYDIEDFSFIKEHYDVPTNVENGTCWIGDKNTFNEIINKNIVNIDSHEIKFEKNNYPILLNLEQYHSSEVLELLDYVKRETLKV